MNLSRFKSLLEESSSESQIMISLLQVLIACIVLKKIENTDNEHFCPFPTLF